MKALTRVIPSGVFRLGAGSDGTVTGDRVPGTPATVAERGDALAEVHAEYVEDSDEDGSEWVPVGERPDVDLSDRELVERAVNAANGDKFARLWRGDTSGYPSHREADQALCTMLAFWTGGDAERIERLFGGSGLVWEKWRERPDYRERTIEKAIKICSEY